MVVFVSFRLILDLSEDKSFSVVLLTVSNYSFFLVQYRECYILIRLQFKFELCKFQKDFSNIISRISRSR